MNPCPVLAWHDKPRIDGYLDPTVMRLPVSVLFLLLGPAAAAPVEFARDVRPIFEAHCAACHGPEKQKSGFRLDERARAFAGGESGRAAIVPGHPESSPLLQLVDGSNPELFMPPRKSEARPLGPAQVATLRAWIAQGASWPEDPPRVVAAAPAPSRPAETHWSFRPLRKPPVPGNASHPVDAFIRAKLREHGLALSPPADRRTWIRRLSFDLTGLPPTPEELARWSEPSPGSDDALVDHLLASPRHGERWARHWLDVVHFGETHGYDKDKPRPNAWPYRDYVIRAFNEDKPYARFVQEQIAGDVLFPGTVDGVTALGFIAAGPWDFIGHAEVPETKIDGKIARHLDRDDMVSNAINTFQSVTVHCAQCHDHKFDPVSQRDYYALHAVFAALDRTDVAYFPTDDAMREYAGMERRRQDLQRRIDAMEEPLRKKAGEAYAALSRRIDAPAPSENPNAGPEFGYHSAVAPTDGEVKWVQVDLGNRVPVRRVVLKPCYDDFGKIGPGFGFPVRFKVEVSDDPEFREGVSLLWRKHDATFMNDFPNPGLTPFETTTADDDGVAGRYVRVTATKLAPRQNDFIFALAELEVDSGTDAPNLAAGRPVTALDSIEAPPRWRRANLTDGVAPSPRAAEDREQLRRERDALLLAEADEPTRRTLLDLRRELAALPPSPAPQKVYAGGIHHGSGSFRGTGPDGGKPRPIHRLRRGDVKQPLEEVAPGGLETLGAGFGLTFALEDGADESARRAALARWLTHPDNALTWRSIVNRVWQYHFGRGLVETPNDFGKMGAPPSHPELLDWLAVWFRDEAKGSLKALHKLIVSSDTYRQTSTPDDATMRRASAFDADNRLLWRQNRRRLEAEAIRDSILLAAGKLDFTMGGPSFQDFVIDKPQHSPHYEYHLADPEDPKIHRRAIYRFLVRSQQQPWMAALDCADPSMLVDRRNETITPLQALAQLNNQLGVTMARHFAERVAREADGPGAQVDAAFRIALQRAPTPEERDALADHVRRHGLTHTCRLILNLNEFVFVD
jgi:mono/diheme cytochrome c family protein